MPGIQLPKTADAVVVGGGTVGAWCAYFLRQAGLRTVVLIEKGVLGQGSSSRAAGVVRVQGGTPAAVRLGQWSRAFYWPSRRSWHPIRRGDCAAPGLDRARSGASHGGPR